MRKPRRSSLTVPRWVILLAGAAVGVIVAGLITLALTPVYESTTRSFVAAVDSSVAGSDMLNAQTFVSERMKSYAQLIDSPAVMQPVIDNLKLGTTPEKLAKNIEVSVDLNSVILSITASDSNAQRSSDIANALMAQLPIAVAAVENPNGVKVVPVTITVFEKAVTPTDNTWPNSKVDLAVGLVLGLLLAVGVIYLRARLSGYVTRAAARRRASRPISKRSSS